MMADHMVPIEKKIDLCISNYLSNRWHGYFLPQLFSFFYLTLDHLLVGSDLERKMEREKKKLSDFIFFIKDRVSGIDRDLVSSSKEKKSLSILFLFVKRMDGPSL